MHTTTDLPQLLRAAADYVSANQLDTARIYVAFGETRIDLGSGFPLDRYITLATQLTSQQIGGFRLSEFAEFVHIHASGTINGNPLRLVVLVDAPLALSVVGELKDTHAGRFATVTVDQLRALATALEPVVAVA
ncbi:hypothetical protein ACFXGA_06340 [Actinosynnema sp. NPDC059335]|uniref:hypothetical protein n=1 Tax=Actinosynnema sp. NPDC059335 TaxID=3346804 RepID=UPI003671C15C